MKVDKETVKKMAHLARLEFNEKEAESMRSDMERILTWVEKLNELDTDGVEPLLSMSEEVNSMREDIVDAPLPHDKAMKNAPEQKNGHFKVPKVIE